jgi:alpha-N-arabinofuranosidase
MAFRNPVLKGFYPDPSICRVGDDFYLVTSSFGYFPGVPLFHSRDLVHWRQIGHCLTREEQLPLSRSSNPGGGIYAPTIRWHRGTFYMTTTNVTDGGHFYVTAGEPAGAWSDPLWVDQAGIDPSLLFDEDGTVYFTSTEGGATGIQQSVIDIKTGRRLTEPRHIWSGTGGQFPEAPHLYRIGDLYYLMIAEGGTEFGHMVTMARSPSPWGPFEPCPGNPILSHRSTNEPIQATGHGDLVRAKDGSWWIVFLGIRVTGYPPCHHLGRETFLAPVSWNEDGWPVVGRAGRVGLEEREPELSRHPWEEQGVRDDFEEPHLALGWNFLANPRKDSWSLSERKGWLRLRGSELGLDDRGPVSFVGRRQQHFACRAAALVEFDPAGAGDEAGLCVFMNRRHHYEIALVGAEGKRQLIVRRRVGDLSSVIARKLLGPGRITLAVGAERDRYSFAASEEGQSEEILAEGASRYLSTEVAGGFTGVYLALYASGNGRKSKSKAFFDWFDYEPRE